MIKIGIKGGKLGNMDVIEGIPYVCGVEKMEGGEKDV